MTKERGQRKILFLICVMASLIMTLCYSRLFSDGARRGIELSAEKLIPSLFPSMVIAELAVSSSIGEVIARPISGLLSKLFNISREASVPFILGMIFGFPVSVRASISLYNEGKIDESELMRLPLFSVIPSPAFFISAVGEGLFGSLKFGAFLYGTAVISCVIIGIATRGLFVSSRGCYFCENFARKKKDVSFVSAVTSSASSLFVICSYALCIKSSRKALDTYFRRRRNDGRSFACLFTWGRGRTACGGNTRLFGIFGSLPACCNRSN